MMRIQAAMTPEERAEWSAMLADAYDGATKAHERGQLVLDMLRDAEQGHRWWVEALIEDTLVAAFGRRANQWGKANRRVDVADEGRTVSKPAVYGTKRQTPTGQLQWMQLPLMDFTRDDITGALEGTETQIGSLALNAKTFRQLAELLDAYPQAATVGDALTLAGLSLDAYLAA